jgi:hypothetical protein
MMLSRHAVAGIMSSRTRGFSSRMALGSHKYQRVEPSVYQMIVNQAIDEGITVIEAGQDEGAISLANVLLGYEGENRLKILDRLGYSVVVKPDGEHPFGTVVVESITSEMVEGTGQVIHSLNREVVQKFFKESPLMDLDEENLDVIPMIHNPEEHGGDTLSRLTDAFCFLEEAVAEKKISSFGIVSNGLSLPPDHPLHLDWRSVVLQAACDAAQQTSKTSSKLSIVQLPANILETRGLQVARDITSYIKDSAAPYLPKQLEVYGMRPLTCFPDQGTGDGAGFQMIDYPIPTEPGVTEWTHQMTNPPPVYLATYRMAVSYFDATELLEAKQERELTDEEQETLEGAKLLLDMIQETDANLEDSRSFAQHEHELMLRVIPILDGTFEEVDDESMKVLQNYFQALGFAARYHIARNTRAFLMKGGEGVKSYDIPKEMTLQDFALQELLKEKSLSKIIVGATRPEHVRETMAAFKRYDF